MQIKSARHTIEKLQEHQTRLNQTLMTDLFVQNPMRADKFSVSYHDLFLDYSKNILTQETLELLFTALDQTSFHDLRTQLFSGENINLSENRPALHTALRTPIDQGIVSNGQNVSADIQIAQHRMKAFSEAVHSGQYMGHSGKKITNIINIGIGGSSIGAQLVVDALHAYHKPDITSHFISNIDGDQITDALAQSDPETTLFIVSSKSFTTEETIKNARFAKKWIVDFFKDNIAVEKHFVAVSSKTTPVKDFGITKDNTFPIWDWVGGRYSVWSAIGLSVVLVTGYKVFQDFLQGAYSMDMHFKDSDHQNNMPVLMAMIGIWYRNFWNFPCHSVVPYAHRLRSFPTWIQQVDMESNGKSVTRNGTPLQTSSGAITFGYPGTDVQHSYFQFLHQGTNIIPIDFIGVIAPEHQIPPQHQSLLSNMIAQAEALMVGAENTDEPHRHFPGNRPSNTILVQSLTPNTLGALMALYEHKTFVQSAYWDINSFDQFGVELGKNLAQTLKHEAQENIIGQHDTSTLSLFKRCFKAQ